MSLWEEWKQYRQSQSSRYKRRQRKSTPPINHSLQRFYDAKFTTRRHLAVKTTTLHRVSSKDCAARRPPWFVAAVTGDAGNPQLLHPLTLKPHHCYLPQNFNLSNFSYFRTSVVSFHTTEFNFDKIFIPLSRAKVLSEDTMFVLLGGGNLIGRPYLVESEHSPPPWFKLSDDMFDDIVVEGEDNKTYALDRLGKLHLILNNVVSRVLRFNTKIDSQPLEGVSGRVGWRKRLVVYSGDLYSVVREEEKVFRLYKFVKRNCCRLSSDYCWDEIKEFHWREVLFVSKDVFFFTSEFGGKEYEGCIVFSESSFPKYGDNGWEYNDEDGVRVYRMSDGRYGSVGESAEFPEIDWSVPSWVLDEGSHSSLHPHSQIVGYDRQPEEDNKGAKSDSKKSNSKDEEEEQEVMDLDSDSHDQDQEGGSDSGVQVLESGKLQCELNSHETEDEEMHSNADIDEDAVLKEVVPPSILASVSAVEEVTQTLFPMNGGNEATEEDTSRTNIAPSALKPCTLSTSKSCQNDSATAKFEGFDVRTDVVPTLQKIWRNHGSIIENSSIGNRDIIGKALESLATMVLTLENNPIQSLSDDQVDYLSTTLSDLKIMSFKVHWLSSLVDKVVKLHKSKALVDSLNKLGQLSTHVQERKASLVNELSKLTEEENKLKEEMAKVSNLIPFLGQVKFDEPLGSGLT